MSRVGVGVVGLWCGLLQGSVLCVAGMVSCLKEWHDWIVKRGASQEPV
jgi:hypothetical protein